MDEERRGETPWCKEKKDSPKGIKEAERRTAWNWSAIWPSPWGKRACARSRELSGRFLERRDVVWEGDCVHLRVADEVARLAIVKRDYDSLECPLAGHANVGAFAEVG